MTPKEQAEYFINSFRMIIMNEDTDCGNEILCTSIAKKNAFFAVHEIIKSLRKDLPELGRGKGYWSSVIKEIENY